MTSKSWLIDQFKAAQQEVQSWSPAKQTMMKNAIRTKRMESDEKKCTICESWKLVVVGSAQRYCEKSKQWPRVGICLYRTVKQSGEVKYEDE